MSVNDETGKLQEDPEFAYPSVEDLKTQAKWVHARPKVLLNGRTTHPERPEDMKENLRIQLEREEENDPAGAPFQSIGEDHPSAEGTSTSWSVTSCGDKAPTSSRIARAARRR